MKTGREWLEMLPKNVQVKWATNLIERYGIEEMTRYIDHNTESTMLDFIGGSFPWDVTPEGQAYWSKIANDPQYKQL